MGSAERDTSELANEAVSGVQLDATGVLDVWDVAVGLDPVGRATAALALALPGKSWSELGQVSLGRRDRLLLGLLGADASSTIQGVAECRACAESMELSIPCASLLRIAPPAEPEPFEHDGWCIRWRLPNGEDLAAASRLDPDADAAAFLLARCVLDVSGTDGPANSASLPAAVRTRLVELIEAWDAFTDIRVDAVCPNCDTPQSVDLDIPILVWKEIDARARTLMREVHALARTYGWTEPQVLALSARRRREYLRLANA